MLGNPCPAKSSFLPTSTPQTIENPLLQALARLLRCRECLETKMWLRVRQIANETRFFVSPTWFSEQSARPQGSAGCRPSFLFGASSLRHRHRGDAATGVALATLWRAANVTAATGRLGSRDVPQRCAELARVLLRRISRRVTPQLQRHRRRSDRAQSRSGSSARHDPRMGRPFGVLLSTQQAARPSGETRRKSPGATLRAFRPSIGKQKSVTRESSLPSAA